MGPAVLSYGLSGAALADLELMLSGAAGALDRFLDPAEAQVAIDSGRLRDGTPAPIAPLLLVPGPVAAAAAEAGALVLTDPEGLPLARLGVTGTGRTGAADEWVAGVVSGLAEPTHGPFRQLRRPPAAVRAGLPAGPVVAVPVDRPLLTSDLASLRAETGHLLLLVRIGDAPDGVPADVLLRATLAAAGDLGSRPTVVAVSLRHGHDRVADERAAAAVAVTYGATDVRTLPAGDWPAALDALRRGDPADVPLAVGAVLRSWRPPKAERGLTVLFTGLSGSGKSTIARAVVDLLLEDGRRRLTVLDGDEVRRMLSAGLGFSRADRDLNVRRIGWVAAEVTRHGGIAICAPIAPYAATRAEVRHGVEATGGDFLLIHVATPLHVCEARDRKGLYARARAGEIPEFTGISDPYEAPDDADLVLDTTGRAVEDCAADVLAALQRGGWVSTT